MLTLSDSRCAPDRLKTSGGILGCKAVTSLRLSWLA